MNWRDTERIGKLALGDRQVAGMVLDQIHGSEAHQQLAQDMGHALVGFTTVHVNRVLQQMRAEGLIELKGERLNIPDWGKLKEVGEFDPTYLHLESDQAAA